MSTMPNLDPETENRTVFTWTIKNFEMCPHQTSEPLKSPEFSLFLPQMAKYRIMLYPRGVNKNNANHVSAYLVKSSVRTIAECYTVSSCEIGIVTANRKKAIFKVKDPPDQGQGRGLATFLDRKDLSPNHIDSVTAKSNGDLTLYCEMLIKKSTDRLQTTTPFSDLSKDIETAYYKELFCDMELKTKGKTFKVHRALIESRFPALVNKSNKGLENIEEETVASLLHYMYTGYLNRNNTQLMDLVDLPDLPYHLKSLLAVKLGNIEAETIISRKRISFTWNVGDILSLNSSDVLSHSIFGSDTQKWTWLHFTLTVSSSGASDGDDILFSIKRYSRNCKRIVCKITALDKCKTYEHTFGDDDCWNIPAFAQRSEVIGEDSNEASFHFEISLTDGTFTSEVNSVDLSPYSKSSDNFYKDLNSLPDDLETMRIRRTHTDVELITSSDSDTGRSFPCHRFMLAARSRVFREMFETTETLHSVTIGDIEPNVVESMLHYLYTGRTDDDHDLKETLDLYELTNRYDIPGLKMECMQHLKLSLSADTIGDVLVSADKWKDVELKECVFDFVCTLPKVVLDSSRMQKLLESRHDLALEIMNRALTCLARGSDGSKEIEEPD